MVNLTSTLLCNASGVDPETVKGKAVVVMWGECDLSQKALVAQNLSASVLLIASTKSLVRHFYQCVLIIGLNTRTFDFTISRQTV